MSTEVIAIIVATATLLVTLGGGALAGFAWIVNRMDRLHQQVQEDLRVAFAEARDETNAQFAEARAATNAQFADARTETNAGFAQVRADMKADFADARTETIADLTQVRADTNAGFAQVRTDMKALADKIDRVHAELTEVKIAVARLEGPMRRLIVPG